MKPLALLPLALVPAAFVIGGLFGPETQVAAPGTSDPARASEALSPAQATVPMQRFEELASNQARLLARLDSLESELAALRAAGRRELVAAEAEAEAEPLAAAASIAAPTRAAILDVLAAEEQRKAEERRVRAEERVMQQTLERARKLAEHAGVDAGGEKVLADLLVAQRARYQDLRASLADLAREDRKEALRAGVEDLAAWRTEQLNTHFDANTAERLRKPLAKADGGQTDTKKRAAMTRRSSAGTDRKNKKKK